MKPPMVTEIVRLVFAKWFHILVIICDYINPIKTRKNTELVIPQITRKKTLHIVDVEGFFVCEIPMTIC
jgi:hypothetical protein